MIGTGVIHIGMTVADMAGMVHTAELGVEVGLLTGAEIGTIMTHTGGMTIIGVETTHTVLAMAHVMVQGMALGIGPDMAHVMAGKYYILYMTFNIGEVTLADITSQILTRITTIPTGMIHTIVAMSENLGSM